MPDRPVIPPTEKMIRQLTAPDHTLGFFTEMIGRESSRFQALSPIKRGSLYSDGAGTDQRVIDAFPALYFCKEIVPFGGTDINTMQQDKYCIWIWSTSPDSESSYNAAIEYLGSAVANPAFTRIYTIRRDAYEASPTIALGTTLTALTGVAITAGGSGYTSASGTVGTGGKVEFVISVGVIIGGIVTVEGSGVTTGASITITGDGTGATATARVQTVSAVLTDQKKSEFPDNDPLSLEFVVVTRTYEVLPGPQLPMVRYDEDLGAIQGYRQAVVNSSQAASLTATAKTTYEARDGSSYVSWKLVEDWSANGGYPITYAKFYDNDRGAVARTTQLEVKASQVGTFTVSGGVVTDTKYLEFNPFLYKKVVETWAVPGPTSTTDFHDNERGEIQRATQIIAATGSEASSSTVGGGIVTKIDYQEYNEKLLKKITETWSVPRTLNAQNYDKTLDVVLPISLKREASGTSIGTNRADVEPQGDGTDKTTLVDITAIQAILDAYSASFPDVASLDLPHVLTGIASIITKSSKEGGTTSAGDASSVGPHGSYSLPGNAGHNSAAAITADLLITIREYWARNIPTTRYVFFLSSTAISADLLARLSTLVGSSVTAWPQFRPVTHSFIVTGEQVVLQCTASVQAHYTYDTEANTSASVAETSFSKDLTLSTQVITLSPTIHGSISISGTTSDTQAVNAAASTAITGTVGASASESQSDTAAATVSPTTLSATAGDSAIPTTGYRLLGSKSELYGYGRSMVTAEVVNFVNVT